MLDVLGNVYAYIVTDAFHNTVSIVFAVLFCGTAIFVLMALFSAGLGFLTGTFIRMKKWIGK